MGSISKIRFIDAFSGMGGFKLSIERAAGYFGLESECVASIEFDNDCRLTYEKNFGHPQTHCDITKIDIDELPEHDFLMGGFPCQPFSRNGKFYNKNNRTLGDDDRKNLVEYLIEILEKKRPMYFLFENVKGLLAIKKEDGSSCLETILSKI